MQSFDKTFQEGFNSYLKLGEQAVSVNDVSMKQNETYVDHGQFGTLYQRNFRASGGGLGPGVKSPHARAQHDGKLTGKDSHLKDRSKPSHSTTQQRDPMTGSSAQVGEDTVSRDQRAMRPQGVNKQEIGVFMAQDGRESGNSSGAYPARDPSKGGSSQVVKKLYQASKPGEAKPRQSIGATKSALGAQGKEHQNKDLVQLELTINSSPYNGAESTSR